MELADIGKTFRRLGLRDQGDRPSAVFGGHERARDVSRKDSAQPAAARAHQDVSTLPRRSKFPGVMAVITRDDILHDEGIEPYYGPVFKDQTIVAVEKVRHVGDPVAAVAALT